MGHTGYSTEENVNNIEVTHLHWGLQLIFDESQKESDNEIWIDIYPLTRFLAKHTQTAVKVDADAKDKIYGAWMEFSDKHCTYAIKYADSPESVIRNYNGYGSEEKLWYQIILVVEDPNEKHLVEAFERLSAGAVLNRPISPNGEGCLYGSLIDRYGFVWEVFACRPVSFPAPPGETRGSAPASP